MRQKRREPGFLRGAGDVRADLRDVAFIEVDDEQQRLCREELKAAQQLQIVSRELQRAKRRAVLERVLASLDQLALLLQLRGFPSFQVLLDPLEPTFREAEVRQNQLVFHRLRVARGIDRAGG